MVAEVGRRAARHPEEEWVFGASYDPALAPYGAFDARRLDRAVAGLPVVLRAYGCHTVWCNTEAPRRAGVTEQTPEPRLGSILRRPDGSPLGTLREWHACDLVLGRLPPRPAGEVTAALRTAGEAYARAGLTWVQDAWVEPDMVDAHLAAARAGALRFRANLALRADPDRWREQRTEFAAAREEVAAAGGELSARTVKFFADGASEYGTAALLAPYEGIPRGARTATACRSGSRVNSPTPCAPSTPTASRPTSTPSATRACGPRSTPWRPRHGATRAGTGAP